MMSWRHSAACLGAPLGWFIPERGRNNNMSKARAICAGCEVRTDCLDFAMSFADKELPGIYGGLTENERAALR